MQNSVLAVDIGFGSTKVAYKLDSGKVHYEKFVSAVGKLPDSEFIQDENLFTFDGNKYYVFESALKLPSDKIIDMMSYEGLRTASPVILRYLLSKYDINPELIVLGLSLSMMQYSADYKKHIALALNLPADKIRLVPQGVGCKICYDLYGTMENTDSRNLNSKNYLGIDIGFNTVDVFQVINGSLSSNTVEGLEKEGIYKVSSKLIEVINDELGFKIDVQESKNIITSGIQVYRSEEMDRSAIVSQLAKEYLLALIKLIENKYASTINKMDNIILVGGGAAILHKYKHLIKEDLDKHYKEGFLIIPNISEYYNVLGYFSLGEKSIKHE